MGLGARCLVIGHWHAQQAKLIKDPGTATSRLRASNVYRPLLFKSGAQTVLSVHAAVPLA